MKVPFFDYKSYCKDIDYNKLLNDVLESGYLIGGPNITAVEKKLKNIPKSKTVFVWQMRQMQWKLFLIF